MNVRMWTFRLKNAYVRMSRMTSEATWFHIARATGICEQDVRARAYFIHSLTTYPIDPLAFLQGMIRAERPQEVGHDGNDPIPIWPFSCMLRCSTRRPTDKKGTRS